MELIRRIAGWIPGSIAAAYVVACFLSGLLILWTASIVDAFREPGPFIAVLAGLALDLLVSIPLAILGFIYIALLVALFGLMPIFLFRPVFDRWWFGAIAIAYGAAVSRWWHGPRDPLSGWGERASSFEPFPVLAMGAVTALVWWVLARRVIVRDRAIAAGTHYVADDGELVRCTD